MQSDDPSVVRRLVVHADDVVTALEANARRDAGAVLRVTPPFAGRMRARLHLAGREADYGDPRPLHVDPAALVADPPAFPTPDDTAERLADDVSVEEHHAAHEQAVEEWREQVREHIREQATIETPAGDHEVEIAQLG
ncbi:hypothetical protein [Halosegnis sp.]|uniref:hypothetical protein n=1 Tax=Halosegnis sp. TaxID=2864959 RepID=UPI0035D519A9